MYGPELTKAKADCDMYIMTLRKKWAQFGVTIMCDGWTGPTHKSLINFLIYCDGDCCFYGSFDVTKDDKDYKCIMKYMRKIVEWVGAEHVVQIVTDNGPNYKKAGERLSREYNFFWTGCAAHSLDLILKDFSKRASVKKVIEMAHVITSYLYNHSIECELMKECCGGDIVRPAVTRFATYFLALQSLHNKRDGLKNLINHDRWRSIKRRKKDNKMQNVEDIINTNGFWKDVKTLIDCLEPVVRTLRLVDVDRVPTMGYLYRWMQMCREKVEQSRRYPQWVLDLIDKQWTKQLSHSLHKAGKHYFIYY